MKTMKTNLEKLIELYTTHPPKIECGTNDYGEYGNNFHMLHHWHTLRENNYELLNELVNFDIETETGIYLIEDYYIGVSKYGKSTKSDGIYNGIRNRIAGHIHEMFYYYWNKYFNDLYSNEWDDVRYNYLKTNYMWRSFIENDTIKVTQLSENPEEERDLINEYLDKGYDLQNPHQIIKRKLLPEMETKCLSEQRHWNIGDIYITNHIYTKLQDTNKYKPVSVYHKYIKKQITREEFLKEIDSINTKDDKPKYRIYDEEFINFDKNFRLRYEQISDEQIKQYDNKYGTRFGIR